MIEISFYSPTVSGNSDPVGRIGKWNGVKTTSIAGQRGSCAGNVKVVHTFVTEWREHPQDLRCDLSVANYKYDDDKVLWTKGKNDTDYSIKVRAVLAASSHFDSSYTGYPAHVA